MLVNTDFHTYKKILFGVGGIITLLLSAYIIGGMIGVESYGVLPLALVLGFFGAFLIFRWPLFGMALISFLAPLGSATRLIGGERALTLPLGGLLLGIFTAKVLVLHEKIKIDRLSKIIFAFVLWGLITALWAYDPERSLNYAVRLFQMLAIYILFLNYCRERQQLDILTLSFVAGALVSAGVAFFGGTTFKATQRITLSDFDPNNFALVLCLALILMTYYFYKTRYKFLRVILILGTVITGYTIIQAQSRGMWIAISLSLLVSLVLASKNSKLIKKAIAAVIILIAIVYSGYYFGVINEAVIHRFQALISGDERTMTAGRSDIWKVGLEMVKGSFPLGVGLKNFEVAYNYYAKVTGIFSVGFSRDAHNTFLAVIAETGVIGFSIFAFIFIYLYSGIRRIADPAALFTYTWLFLCFVLGNLSLTNYFGFYFWIALILIALRVRLESQSTQRVIP